MKQFCRDLKIHYLQFFSTFIKIPRHESTILVHLSELLRQFRLINTIFKTIN